MSSSPLWDDIHDPLVRDLAGRARVERLAAAFAQPLVSAPIIAAIAQPTDCPGLDAPDLNPFLLCDVCLETYINRLDAARVAAAYSADPALLLAAQAAGRSMGAADAAAGQIVISPVNNPRPDAITSAPVGPLRLEGCGECPERDRNVAAGQTVTTDDDVDPLVVDPIDAMVADHIHIGGLNRLRRHDR